MFIHRAVVIAIFLSFLISCSPRDGELGGDVFIVTKGGQNYKLGLVTVSAIPSEPLKKHIDKRR